MRASGSREGSACVPVGEFTVLFSYAGLRVEVTATGVTVSLPRAACCRDNSWPFHLSVTPRVCQTHYGFVCVVLELFMSFWSCQSSELASEHLPALQP